MTSGAEKEIRRRIHAKGSITFREFMELALYWPDGAYYTSRSATADYYTAPAAHPAFGALICLQLYQMWLLLGRAHPFWVIEPGAGNGQLQRDITTCASQLPSSFSHALRYVCIEHRPWSTQRVPVEAGSSQSWLAAACLPFRNVVGVVLSNELLDAFPVHRVRMGEDGLQEVYVTVEDGQLIEKLDRPSTPALAERLRRVGVSLEEDWEAEINLGIDNWAYQVSACLKCGFVVTVDYGRSASELYSPERARGTLTTFRDHIQTDNPLSDVGYQDITTQVDFTALEKSGTAAGLDPSGLVSQRRFLLNLGIRNWLSSLGGAMNEAEANANRMGMQQLIRPGGMGDFQVMFQAKGVEPADLWCLSPSAELETLAGQLAPPRLTPSHAQLLEASYPHLGQSYQHLWPGGETV